VFTMLSIHVTIVTLLMQLRDDVIRPVHLVIIITIIILTTFIHLTNYGLQ
jgi:hypothetical protein